MSERPRLRSDLVFVEQTYRGELSFIVKDPTTHKYFRFRPVEIAVMRTLDGLRTSAEAAGLLAEEGIRVSAAAVGKFAEKLKSMGLCERTLRERSVLQMERLRALRRKRLSKGPFQGELLRLRWSVGDPDRFMDRTLPWFRPCFTRQFVGVSLVLFAIYFLIVALRWPQFTQALGDFYHFRFSGSDLVLLWLTVSVIIVIHELGHGYTCKHFGGHVHEIGAMLLYFQPAFFCNVNDAWTFPELRARLWVTAAGSWIQMVVASLAAIVWWLAAPDTTISQVALFALIFGGITTVLMNVNPLVPLDGYYALSDWLEVPNLRQRALAHLVWTLKTRLLRLDLPMPPADEREQRIFLLYGALAALYIGSIFLAVGGAVYGWLSGLLGGLGAVIFALAVWLMVRDSLRAWGRSLAQSWEQRRGAVARGLRSRRFAAGGLLGCVVLLGFVLHRPITVTGPFEVNPAARFALIAPDSGVVFQVLGREGSLVEPGATVVQIRNLALEREADAAARAADSLGVREAQARARRAEGEAARLAASRAAELVRADGLRRRSEALTLRAPMRAVVLTPRPDTLEGLRVSLGDTLLMLGTADSIEIRMALEGAGAPLVRVGQRTRLVAHADPGLRLTTAVGSVAPAAPGGAVEARIRLPSEPELRPGMTGEASVTTRQANLWGALAWAIRRRVRTDLLL